MDYIIKTDELKTTWEKTPWEWIASNIGESNKRNICLAVVAENATMYDVLNRLREYCGEGFKCGRCCSYVFISNGCNNADIYMIDSMSKNCHDTLSALELDGAVVGKDVPFDVVKHVRDRIGRTKNKLNLGCYVMEDKFSPQSSEECEIVEEVKKESNESARTVPIDVFRCGVCLLVGTDMEELRKAFKSVMKNNLKDEKEADDYFDYFLGCVKDSGTFTGLYVAKESEPDVIIYLPEFKESVLVHEIVHAVTHILNDRGVKDDETRAYLTEYLYRKITNKD